MEEQKTSNTSSTAKTSKQGLAGKLLIPLSILLAGVIIATAIIFDRSAPKSPTTTTPTTTGTDTTQQANVNIKDVVVSDEPFIGDANAPVTLAYWSDYQCPFCKEFETTTLSTIRQNYVDTGKVKVVFKDYSFLGDDSDTAALYARAVWELYPDKFFSWREAIFDKQDSENSGFGNEDDVKSLTKTVSGIDGDKVAQYVSDHKSDLLNKIEADKTEGAKLGVQGTPGFITGTTLIPGAVSYTKFSQAIDPQLK